MPSVSQTVDDIVNTTTTSTTIVWFRNDLRLHDNRVLAAAAAAADRLLCVYIHEPQHDLPTAWGFRRMGLHRRRFLADTLAALSNSLAAYGQRLRIYAGQPRLLLPALARELGAKQLYCEAIAAPEEESELAALQQADLVVTTVWQSSLLDPQDLPFATSALPRVFTEFRKRVESVSLQPRALLPAPEFLPPPPSSSGSAELSETTIHTLLGGVSATADPRSSFPYALPDCHGGESAALRHLQRYFSSALPQSYKHTRNGLAGLDFSTKLSPWLASGALSPRRVFFALRAHEARFGANDSTYWIWFELLWRDYFRFLHLAHGRQLYRAAGLSRLPTPTHDSGAFSRWCGGETGEPFIDAGMRELWATGFLSNRLRQNVASYLINDLGADFRAGAAWFEAQLVDYDVYSNQGNWLYLAGRGTDPRAGRRFEPTKQARDYDPQSRYRDLWNAGN